MPHKKTQIAIVDDQKLIRIGLSKFLEEFNEVKIVFGASNGLELQDKLKKHPNVSIILMDVGMPIMDGYDSTRWVKANYPHIHVLAMSASDDETMVIEMLKAGAGTYLLKESTSLDFLIAIRSLKQKGFYINDLVSGRLLATLKKDIVKPTFTDKQLTLLKFCSTELTYKEIAEQMGISHRTVDNYRESLFLKFNVKSRTGLIVSAIRYGMIKV